MNNVSQWLYFKNSNKKLFRALEALSILSKKFGFSEGANKTKPDILGMLKVIQYENYKEREQREVPVGYILSKLCSIDPTKVSESDLIFSLDTEKRIRDLNHSSARDITKSDVVYHWLVELKTIHLTDFLILKYLFLFYEFEDKENIMDTLSEQIAQATSFDVDEFFHNLDTSDEKVDTVFFDSKYLINIESNEWRKFIGVISSQVI